MAQFKQWFDQDFTNDIVVRHCESVMFTGDDEGAVVGVHLYDNGTPYSGGGAVTGAVKRLDGGRVVLTGTLSGNAASVVIPAAALAYAGPIGVQIILFANGEKTTVLKAVYSVDDTNGVNFDPGELVPDIDELLAEIETMRQATADAESAAEQANNAASNIEGRFERLARQKVNRPETDPNGTAGQVLRTNGDGTTTWVSQGLPTDEQTAEAVNAWLDDHPEATTTVPDGSITPAKLAPSTFEYFSKRACYNVLDYGIQPDTGEDVYNALFNLVKLIEADGTGGTVFFPRGEYILSDCIFIPSNTIFMGEGPATHIVFNETYADMGVGLSNGGDNCGVMNMTVDCANTSPIASGSMTGGIGFSTFDGTSITVPHQSSSASARRNTKNVFAHNIWTNTRYILQAETEGNYTMDGVTYTNIYGEKSCVSVQGIAAIKNVKIDNVICAIFRTGFSSYSDAVSLQATNIKCGIAELIGKDVQISNLIVDPSLIYDALNTSYSVFVSGKVSITNADINGLGKAYLIMRDSAELRLANVKGYNAGRWLANNIGISDPNWGKLYFSNCNISQSTTDRNIVPGIASSSELSNISDSEYTTLRNRQTETYYPTLGSNENISATSGRRSKIEVYDRKIVRIYLNLVLLDAANICTLPTSKPWLIKNLEPFVGYAWSSAESPIRPTPCLCTIGESGEITAISLTGSAMNVFNRFVCDATYMLD